MADRDDVIRKVQALWAKADATNFEAEREAFVAKARDLMAQYTIDEMVLQEAGQGAVEAVVMADIRIMFDDDKDSNDVADQRIMLANFIGIHNRCKCVVRRMPASVGEDGRPIRAGTYLTAVGFKSDVDTVRAMYSLIAVDMMFCMLQEPTSHMRAAEKRNYFANFADGYAWRISERLAEINRKVHDMAEHTETSHGSMALVLQSREVEVADRFAQMFPKLGKQKVAKFSHDPNAQKRGQRAAENADLGGKKVGQGSPKGELR